MSGTRLTNGRLSRRATPGILPMGQDAAATGENRLNQLGDRCARDSATFCSVLQQRPFASVAVGAPSVAKQATNRTHTPRILPATGAQASKIAMLPGVFPRFWDVD
jgi:hypothetical protein